jgi:hypothetical protein
MIVIATVPDSSSTAGGRNGKQAVKAGNCSLKVLPAKTGSLCQSADHLAVSLDMLCTIRRKTLYARDLTDLDRHLLNDCVHMPASLAISASMQPAC